MALKIDLTTSRSLRQAEALQKWKSKGGRALIILPTGMGKTVTSMRLVEAFRKQRPDFKVVVVVPTLDLKEQWENGWQAYFDNLNHFKCMVINTAAVTKEACDLLVVDEVHTSVASEFVNVYSVISFTYFLGLTGTIERLDGKEGTLLRSFPIADEVKRDEAIANGWLNDYTEYKVMLKFPNRDEYELANAKFLKAFNFFENDFQQAMRCTTDWKARNAMAKLKRMTSKEVMGAAMNFKNALKDRMAMVASHPKKVDVANNIIQLLPEAKGLVFASTIEDTEQIAGHCFHSKLSAKDRKQALAAFNSIPNGFLASVRALDLGVDVKELNTAIILYGSSSKIQKAQRVNAYLEGSL